MTLLERSQGIRQRLAYQSQLRAGAEKARQVKERTKTIDEWRRALALAVGQIEELKSAGRNVKEEDGTAAILACRRFAEKVKAGTAGDADWAVFKAAVEEQVSAAERSAIDGAKAVHAEIRSLQVDGLEAMAKIRGRESELAAVRQEKVLLERENWTDRPAEQLRNLLQRRAKLLAAMGSLSDMKAPPEVQAFLDKARRSEALVEHLVPEVRHWLEVNDLLGKLRITLGGR